MLIDDEKSFDLSENNIKECNWYGTGCDEGMYSGTVANYLTKAGTVLEACDPYTTTEPAECKTDCPYQQTPIERNILSTSATPDTNTLKATIKEHGRIILCRLAGV